MKRLALIELATGRVTQINFGEGDVPTKAGFAWHDDIRGDLQIDDVVHPDGSATRPPPPQPQRVVSLRSFFRLFTRTEALQIASLRDAQDQDVVYFWLLASMGPEVDLEGQDTLAGLEMLLSKRVITSERAVAIASGVPPPVGT